MNCHIVNLQPFNSGGNGELLLGRRSDNGEPVVVKYLRDFNLAHARRAFSREVGILRRNLPGLIPLLFADTAAPRPYYVMPFQNGGTLAQYAGRLRDDQLQLIAAQLGRTLANLHSAFQAHGDVKPDNVLVTDDGRLQVADPLGGGGLLTILFSENRGGTPGYCAPEIRAGGSISRAGDVYSFGATLHHLLTGRRPQDGQELGRSCEGYGVAPKILEVITACCHWDPNARPTMHEVLRVLNGERWADIQARKREVESFVGVALLVGLAVFAIGALAQGQAG